MKVNNRALFCLVHLYGAAAHNHLIWYRTRGVIVSFFYFSGRKIYTRIEAAPLIEAAEAKIRNRNTIEAAAYTRHNTVYVPASSFFAPFLLYTELS